MRLWFTDVLGQLKSVAISPVELETAFEEGVQFDGSAIDGFSRDQSAEWLPDGIHPTDEAARRIWLEYLGPALRSTIRETWPALYDS